MTISDKIIKWVDENKGWFKVSHLAEICKVDRGNFTRYMQTEIPEKYLPAIMEFLMPLGFTLGEVIKENNKPENKARILEERNTHNIGKKFENTQPLTESEMMPPMPKREDFEKGFTGTIDFGAAKSEWKKKYNQ